MLTLKVDLSFPQAGPRSHALRGNAVKGALRRELTLKLASSFPRSGVGMQSEPLRRLGTQSVPHGIPTETVGTITEELK